MGRGEFGLRVPFFAAAGLATFNLVLGYFVVTETVTNNTRHPFDLKPANPLQAPYPNSKNNRPISLFTVIFSLSVCVLRLSCHLGLLRKSSVQLGLSHG